MGAVGTKHFGITCFFNVYILRISLVNFTIAAEYFPGVFFGSLKFIIASSILLIQLNEEKLIHFMEFETHVILIQNVFSVLPLYFTALISKASKAYD